MPDVEQLRFPRLRAGPVLLLFNQIDPLNLNFQYKLCHLNIRIHRVISDSIAGGNIQLNVLVARPHHADQIGLEEVEKGSW